MSKFYWDYNDDSRNIEIEINYTYTEGHYETGPHGYGRYWVHGDLEIHEVYVIAVTYYNPDGEVIAHIEREMMQEDAVVKLDAETFNDVKAEAEKWGYFADKLIGHA